MVRPMPSTRGRPHPGYTMTSTPRAHGTRPAAPALANTDTFLLLVVLAMVLLGLIMVLSASQYADPIDPGAYARRDALWAGIGIFALLVTMRVDYHHWQRLAPAAMIIAFLLMLLVVRMGVSVGGAQRWLTFGSLLTFQPSEIAKLAFILFAADWLARQSGPLTWQRLRPLGLVIVGIIGLVLWQNDLGTALVVAACALALLLLADIPLQQLVVPVLVGSMLGTLVIAGSSFRRARILSFLHPLQCRSAYHICQALIAIGSGGIFGRGLGHSIQKAGYLPAPFTDSIYAVIGEELGFWGASLVLLLVALLVWRGWRIAMQASDRFGALLAMGITCWLSVQAMLNIGSTLAAIPFTGVPLPFISFGGSSLVVSLAAVGMLLNIAGQDGHGSTKKCERTVGKMK